MKKTKKGFTLVELLVVIAIIAILAAIIAPNAFKAIEKSKVATAEADYKAIKTAALGYYSDNGTWTTNSALLVSSSNNGPYLEKWKEKNPWNGNYTLRNTAVEGLDITTNHNYLILTDVPTTAIDRLEADLDGADDADAGTVRYNKTAKTVYIIISEQ